MALEEDSSIVETLRRVFTAHQISNWLLGGILLLAILVESGIIWVLVETPPLMGFGGANPTFIQYNPTLGSQVLTETIIIVVIIFLGVLGLYLMKSATRYVDETERGVLVLIIGIFLFLGNILLLWLVFNYKLTNEFPKFII